VTRWWAVIIAASLVSLAPARGGGTETGLRPIAQDRPQSAAASSRGAVPETTPTAFMLKVTLRLSVAKVDAAPAASPYAGFGALLAQLLTPAGPVTFHYTVSGDTMRADIDGRLATLAPDSIVLQRVGEESIRVLNPMQKTWYELPASQNLGALLSAPDVDMQPTGERATIAGQRGDRFRFNETVQIPAPEGVSLPPDFPQTVRLTGDLWSTDAFAGDNYRPIFHTLQAFAAVPGMEALTAGGRFPLRILLRSDFMPGYELRTEVTAIGSAARDGSLFVIPSAYQKVQPPFGGGR
jgi:hypothetical protein